MNLFRTLARLGRVTIIAVASALMVVAWILYISTTYRGGASTAYIIFETFVIVLLIVRLIGLCIERERLSTILLVLGYSVLFMLVVFANLYWSYGTPPNFSMPLTHLDAFYFALGTLSTAGTGTINATSELARTIQAVQMALDSALVLFAVGLVVARFSSTSDSSAGKGREP